MSTIDFVLFIFMDGLVILNLHLKVTRKHKDDKVCLFCLHL